MPYNKTAPFATPFGKNVYLRSTRDLKFESRTIAAETVPLRTIDGHPNQRILQPGTVLARITSGPHTGKVGPFQAAGSGANEVQTITPGTTTAQPTGGTFTITLFPGVTGSVTTAAIAFNANGAAVQAALRAALATSTSDAIKEFADSITATIAGGGNANAAVTTVTYVNDSGENVPQLTVDVANLTASGTPTMTVATTTAGVAGATDGRGTLANIVGICDTFLPYQLLEGDAEVAVLYDGAVYQSKCIELDANGAEIALTDTTAAQMFGKKSLNITFHVYNTEIN